LPDFQTPSPCFFDVSMAMCCLRIQSRSRIKGLVAGFGWLFTLKNDNSGRVSGHLAVALS
jgi:hypothetical protein